jgi:hypothetical protein
VEITVFKIYCTETSDFFLNLSNNTVMHTFFLNVELLGLRPQGSTEGSEYGPVHHWSQVSCHPGPLYQAVSEEGPKNCQRLQPLSSDCSLCYRMASGTGAPSLSPKGFLTASTPSHKTPEHLIKWLPRLLTPPPPNLSFTLLLLSVYYLCIVTSTLPTCTY